MGLGLLWKKPNGLPGLAIILFAGHHHLPLWTTSPPTPYDLCVGKADIKNYIIPGPAISK
jgi:hypothetical protein